MTPTDPALPRAAKRVAAALQAHGHAGAIRLLDDSARSAADAAAALGVAQEQIVKSLIFRGERSGQAILALVGGLSRVAEDRLAAHVGEPVGRASADWVREQTGYSIGGVPPVGHAGELRTVADRSLVSHSVLWAAAGTPHAVFPLSGSELVALTGAELGEIRE
jgi:prolyl-tRNA editing enzyme YbaK/EbsC (Cys-tRNA(Pro) deacylase)